MTTSTGPMRAAADSGRPLGYLTPEQASRAIALYDGWAAWTDHYRPLDLATWAGRAAGLLGQLIADTHAGGIPQ